MTRSTRSLRPRRERMMWNTGRMYYMPGYRRICPEKSSDMGIVNKEKADV